MDLSSYSVTLRILIQFQWIIQIIKEANVLSILWIKTKTYFWCVCLFVFKYLQWIAGKRKICIIVRCSTQNIHLPELALRQYTVFPFAFPCVKVVKQSGIMVATLHVLSAALHWKSVTTFQRCCVFLLQKSCFGRRMAQRRYSCDGEDGE